MASRRFDEARIRQVIETFIETGGNYTYTVEKLRCSYNVVLKYVRLWQGGGLAIEGLPPVAIAATETKTAGDLPRLKALKGENAALKKERDELQKELETAKRVADMVDLTRKYTSAPPNWTLKNAKSGKSNAIATAFLSDVHLDEVVDPAQVNWINAYNRDIATERLRLFFENAIELARDYLGGLRYEGLVLPLGGDIFAGIIHEELAESNEGTIFQSMLYWADPMCAGIKLMRDAFGQVFLPCVVGNHGRRKRKPHAKNRPQDNFEYLFYHLLAKMLKDEKGIDFAISESADLPYQVYQTRYLLTHGDQFKGGSGIAGMLSPLLLGDARKREREVQVKRPYDVMVMGHWHQLAFVRGLIINGSVSGYDEYAFISNFRYEPPRQAFWVTDPVHGVTITAPIHVAAKDEMYSSATGTQAVVGVGWGNEPNEKGKSGKRA